MKHSFFLRPTVGIALAVTGFSLPACAQDTPCFTAPPHLPYEKWEDAAFCALRPVLKYGHLGPEMNSFPAPLKHLFGSSVSEKIDVAKFRHYLQANNIKESDIGGSLDAPLVSPRYFVIHDTSTPIPKAASFPAYINSDDWSGNYPTKDVTHVYINRLGRSFTSLNFGTPLVGPNHAGLKVTGQTFGTKRERNSPKLASLFLHVENVQPRMLDSHNIDSIVPTPGFTPAQRTRLAVVYIAASWRRGHWLIPAYHAVIDTGLPNGHDDPQNFDFNNWCLTLGGIMGGIEKDAPVAATFHPATRAAENPTRQHPRLPNLSRQGYCPPSPRFSVQGKMSTFGGPKDFGMTPSEGLAIADGHYQELKSYFLPQQPPGTTGLGRRLNPTTFYVACRWNYAKTSTKFLRQSLATVTNPANGKSAQAKPMDWGPNKNTGRMADLSPGLAKYLGLKTNNICKVVIP